MGQSEPHAARMGELLFGKALSARRIGRLTPTRRRGYCAGGCASSTKSGDEGAGAIHSRTSTGTFGLVRLSRLGHDVPWTKACKGLVREPDAGKNLPVRLCVQRRLAACSAGERACRGKQGQKPRSLDSSGGGKPRTLKPIDNVSRGGGDEFTGAVTTVNARSGLESA